MTKLGIFIAVATAFLMFCFNPAPAQTCQNCQDDSITIVIDGETYVVQAGKDKPVQLPAPRPLPPGKEPPTVATPPAASACSSVSVTASSSSCGILGGRFRVMLARLRHPLG